MKKMKDIDSKERIIKEWKRKIKTITKEWVFTFALNLSTGISTRETNFFYNDLLYASCSCSVCSKLHLRLLTCFIKDNWGICYVISSDNSLRYLTFNIYRIVMVLE